MKRLNGARFAPGTGNGDGRSKEKRKTVRCVEVTVSLKEVLRYKCIYVTVFRDKPECRSGKTGKCIISKLLVQHKDTSNIGI